jgi:hypothetical protein
LGCLLEGVPQSQRTGAWCAVCDRPRHGRVELANLMASITCRYHSKLALGIRRPLG